MLKVGKILTPNLREKTMARNRNHALRNARRTLARKLLNKTADLRVVGTEKTGIEGHGCYPSPCCF